MKTKDDYDSPWKEAIHLHFRDFLLLFFPEIHDDIDWERGYELLESELRAITRAARHGRRHVDALVRVYRRNGSSQLVLIHVEIQAQKDPLFTARMLLYHSRIADRFGESVCSLAVLADTQRSWRPSGHRNAIWGCVLELKFRSCKLLDYPAWASGTSNPFSWLTAAHLQAQATRGQPERRAEIKFRLIRGLYECGMTRPQVQGLFRLLDWVLALPAPLEYTFKQDLARFEKEKSMPYITSVERICRKEGREAGLKEGLKEGRQAGLKDGRKVGHKEGHKEGVREAQERACQALREAILARHHQRWGELDSAAQARLLKLSDHPRLVELLADLMVANSSQEWISTF